ncbi:3301_t:CDS:1, partial [Scutellospora calospora]
KEPTMQSIVDRPANSGYLDYTNLAMNVGSTYDHKHERGNLNGVNESNGQHYDDIWELRKSSYNGRNGYGRGGNGGRNGYSGNGGGNGNRRIRIPNNYRAYVELTFRVTNFHAATVASELMDYFRLFGNVYKITIETAEIDG